MAFLPLMTKTPWISSFLGSPVATGAGAASVTLLSFFPFFAASSRSFRERTASAWITQTYGDPAFGGLLSGLGLVLDAGSSVKLAQLTVTTPTPGFQGYMIAVCNFRYAHGFAYISDVGAQKLAHGYLALVLDNASTDTGADSINRTGIQGEGLMQ